eukprot:783710-Lingulodinium_polyedra.AAC.1
MYVVTDNNTYHHYSKATSGGNDRDPDSCSAKYVHIPTGPGHSTIRMDHAQTSGRGVGPSRVTETGPSALLFKVPGESPRTKPQQRAAGIPGRAAGTSASGPMAFQP